MVNQHITKISAKKNKKENSKLVQLKTMSIIVQSAIRTVQIELPINIKLTFITNVQLGQGESE